MADRYPGGVISKTPPTITAPVDGEGGSASGMWTLDTVLEYEKAGAWPKPVPPRELYAWGQNNKGQLGDGTVISRSSPVQIGSLTNWAQVSAGGRHSASVKTDGTLWSWGYNQTGQLGSNVSFFPRSSPAQVGALTDWSQVSAGYTFTLAVKTNKTLWAWGNNTDGQIGDNTTVSRSSPVQIGALTNWSQVSAGAESTAAVKADGTLWTWGRNSTGELGDNTVTNKSSPIQVGALTNWSQVAIKGTTSGGFCAAVKTDGTLWTWGRNSYGQLGINTVVNRSSPVQVGSLTNWSRVDIYTDHSVSIKTDGTLWAWGANNQGQLGDNTVIFRSSPVQVGALTNWAQVSAGFVFTVAAKTDKTLWAWGYNGQGQIGDNTITTRSSPVQVGALTNWHQVSAGGYAPTAPQIIAITKG